MAYFRRDNRSDRKNHFNQGGRRNSRDQKFGGGSNMHPAVCDECGNNCQVPFKPTGNRPVLCSSCFEDSKGGGNNRNNQRERRGSFDRPRYNERRMHHAVCDSCGNECEVPFKPTGEKPIYCSDCFGKGKNLDQPKHERKEDSVSNAQLEELNKKLDTIIRMLAPVLSATSEEVNPSASVEIKAASKQKKAKTSNKTEKVKSVKKEKAKKVPKKKATTNKAASKKTAKKAVAKKTTTKKTAVKKVATKKSVVKKGVTKKTTNKKVMVKKTVAKKSVAKKTASKKKTAVKKTVTKKKTAKK